MVIKFLPRRIRLGFRVFIRGISPVEGLGNFKNCPKLPEMLYLVGVRTGISNFGVWMARRPQTETHKQRFGVGYFKLDKGA